MNLVSFNSLAYGQFFVWGDWLYQKLKPEGKQEEDDELAGTGIAKTLGSSRSDGRVIAYNDPMECNFNTYAMVIPIEIQTIIVG